MIHNAIGVHFETEHTTHPVVILDANADGDVSLDIITPEALDSAASPPIDPDLIKYSTGKKMKTTKAIKRKRDEENPEDNLATMKARYKIEDERHLLREEREIAKENRARERHEALQQSETRAQEQHEASQRNEDRFMSILEQLISK